MCKMSDSQTGDSQKRNVVIAVLAWVACIVAIFPMSGGALPFNRPLVARMSFRTQVAIQVFQPVFPLFLMGVTYLLTRRRAVPNLAARAPEVATARRETLLLWAYGGLVLAVGQILGRRLFGEG